MSQAVDENKANLVLCFGSKSMLETDNIYSIVKSKFPASQIAICSTAGEMYQDIVSDNSLVAFALTFEKKAKGNQQFIEN